MRQTEAIVNHNYETKCLVKHFNVINMSGEGELNLPTGTVLICTKKRQGSPNWGNNHLPQFKVTKCSDNRLINLIVAFKNLGSVQKIKATPPLKQIPTSRLERAKWLRVQIADAQIFIKKIQTKQNEVRNFITDAEAKANSLEQFKSDKEALASMLAQAITTGGDAEKIQLLISKSGLIIGEDKEEEIKVDLDVNIINERFTMLEFT